MIQYLLPQKKVYTQYKIQNTPKLYKGIFSVNKEEIQPLREAQPIAVDPQE